MSSCTIQLDNFHGYYISGSTITGKVVCVFRKPKNIRGVRISLKGLEHTSWTEWETYRVNNETIRRAVHYSGDNTFLAVETSLTGGGDIGPGVFEYPFMFVLPKNLPGTYLGTYGWIKYTMKATVDRPYKFDFESIIDLSIVGIIDFNEMAGQLQLQPVGYSDFKTLCCCCCKSGPITMTVQLEKEAFVQGETVNVKVDITNLSNKKVESVEVEIKRKIESRVIFPRSRVRLDEERLAFSKETGVEAQGERSYTFILEVPRSAVLPNFALSTLFAQWSKIKVTAVLPVAHKNLKVSSNIVMGHIPVGAQVQSVSFDQLAYLQPSMPPQAQSYPPSVAPYPSTLEPYAPSSGAYPQNINPASYPPNIGTQFPFATDAPSHAFPFKPGSNSEPFSAPTAPVSEDPSAPSKSQMGMGGPPPYEEATRPK